MSADNYYLVRRHPDGGFTTLMGSGSEMWEPVAESRHKSFPTLDEAWASLADEWSEYGNSIHDECYRANPGPYSWEWAKEYRSNADVAAEVVDRVRDTLAAIVQMADDDVVDYDLAMHLLCSYSTLESVSEDAVTVTANEQEEFYEDEQWVLRTTDVVCARLTIPTGVLADPTTGPAWAQGLEVEKV